MKISIRESNRSRVSIKSFVNTRKDKIENRICFLSQSDTTAGFLSTSQHIINHIKKRKQNILIECLDFMYLKTLLRIPLTHRAFIRRAQKVSFIYPNKKCARVVKNANLANFVSTNSENIAHVRMLEFYPIIFSSSANAHGAGFSLKFALESVDALWLDYRGIKESTSSKIFKLNRARWRKIR